MTDDKDKIELIKTFTRRFEHWKRFWFIEDIKKDTLNVKTKTVG